MDTCCNTYVERGLIQTELHLLHDDTTHNTDTNDTPPPRRLGRAQEGQRHSTPASADRLVRGDQAHKQRAQWVYTKGMVHAIQRCDWRLHWGFCIYKRWEIAPAFEVLDAYLVLYQYQIAINLNIMIVPSFCQCLSVVGIEVFVVEGRLTY